MYSHFIKDLREAFWAHATFLLPTVITSPRFVHLVVPGLITAAGVRVATAGVGVATAGVGVATAGVGVATAGVGVATLCVSADVETYRSKKAEPTLAQEITYLNFPAVFGAVKVNEVLPLLPMLKVV